MHVRTRIAPSPTGALHVGTARTALFNYLFSKHEKGAFLLRIEDTDLERSDKKYERDIIEGLRWLGIEWDGEITRQSERLDIYEKYLNKLLESGNAFYCQHSEEELETERKAQAESKMSPKHICDARDQKLKDGIIRFKNTTTESVIFRDEIRGEISFNPKLLGDFSLAKNTRTPLYNFAVVVDDAEMEISHVIRGEDHIPNTPKQILLQDSLGFPRPKYAHLPLILGQDRSKLSKRHGATSVNEYRDAGYLPEALFNFMALLGWRPGGAGEGNEIYSREELVKTFSLEKIQKAGAIFDIQKLDWMNGHYIRSKSVEELTTLVMPFLEKAKLLEVEPPVGGSTSIDLKKVIGLEQPRLKKLSELPEKVDYFFKKPEYDASLLKWKNMTNDEIKKALEKSKQIISNFQFAISKQEMEKIFLAAIGKGDKGELLWPLRVALSGKKASPGPFEIMEILGQKTSILRVNAAIDKLG